MKLRFFLFLCCLGVQAVSLSASESASRSDPFELMRKSMVDTQLAGRDITHPLVLDAMSRIPREEFVPGDVKPLAYSDGALPIGEGQTISQPYIVAFMTQLIDPQETDRVLEIGTGSGYQAAVLAEIVKEVYTIEIVESLALNAERRLTDMGYRNVAVKHGDGWLGWSEHAPFDKIVVTAAPEVIPPALVEQLKEGGLIVVPVGKVNETQQMILGEKRRGVLKKTKTIPVRFVPFVH